MSPLCKLLYTHSVIGFKDKYSRDKAKYHCENLKGHVSKGKISLTYISLYSKSELFFLSQANGFRQTFNCSICFGNKLKVVRGAITFSK
jgi:hypothetical protein